MKLLVTQENLTKAISLVSRVAASRTTLPILSNIVIRTNKTQLQLVATNLEIAITATIGSKVEQEGAVAVPAKLMNDFVSSLPAGPIELVHEDGALQISAEQYSSSINTALVDEFPELPQISAENSLNIPALALKEALQQVVFAASGDDARPVLTGVYMHAQDGKLTLVSTDSYRLAEKQILDEKSDISVLIPATAMAELARIINDAEADSPDVAVQFDDAQVRFSYGDIELISRLVEGNFPDYKQLIPKESEVSFTIDKAEFLSITKVSSLFARESAGSITLHVSEEAGEVSIQSIASQVGENTSRAKAVVFGEGDVTLNSRFLIDGLNACKGKKVTFAFNGRVNPCVLTAEGQDDYLHIVMPLRS